MLIEHSSVVLEASVRRPSTSMRPWTSSSRSSWSALPGEPAGPVPFVSRSTRLLGGGDAAVAVLARAHVAGGVERLGAQRAQAAAGGDDTLRAGRERPGPGRREEDAQRVGALVGVV